MRKGRRITVSAFGMGAPIAAIVLHELFDLGVRCFLRIGTAMVMSPAKLGDFVLADGALRGEGALEPTRLSAILPSRISNSALRASAGWPRPPWRAGVFGTYDGFYTEMFALNAGRQPIDGLRAEILRLGLIATDMETATLLVAGRVLGARASSLCLGTVDGLTQGRSIGAELATRNAICSKLRSTRSSRRPRFRSFVDAQYRRSLLPRALDRLENVRDAGRRDRSGRRRLRRFDRQRQTRLRFGTGHGSLPAIETFPRTGTIVGFRPIVESTMISFHRVWGDMGARQYRFIHAAEGYGKAILKSHSSTPTTR